MGEERLVVKVSDYVNGVVNQGYGTIVKEYGEGKYSFMEEKYKGKVTERMPEEIPITHDLGKVMGVFENIGSVDRLVGGYYNVVFDTGGWAEDKIIVRNYLLYYFESIGIEGCEIVLQGDMTERLVVKNHLFGEFMKNLKKDRWAEWKSSNEFIEGYNSGVAVLPVE